MNTDSFYSTLSPIPQHPLWRSARACTACELRPMCQGPVPGEGYVDEWVKVMFVGEAPGRNEDIGGRPFVGKAGQLLDELLNRIGMRREDVFITNTVLCRPSGSGVREDWEPSPEHIEICAGLWLEPTLMMVKPKIVVTLGVPATSYFLGRRARMDDETGLARMVSRNGLDFLLLPIYHPAAGLRSSVMMGKVLAGFDVLRAINNGTWEGEVRDEFPEPKYAVYRSGGYAGRYADIHKPPMESHSVEVSGDFLSYLKSQGMQTADNTGLFLNAGQMSGGFSAKE